MKVFAVSCQLVFFLLSVTPADAATYDLTAFSFTSPEGSQVEGTLTTSEPVVGQTILTSEAEIESFFNSAIYSITIRDNNGDIVAVIDDTNSQGWNLTATGDVSAALTIEPEQLTLDYSTPLETTEIDLAVRGPEISIDGNPLGFSQFIFSQQNNVSDRTQILADAFAINFADSLLEYDSAFLIPAVPEPASRLLVMIAIGLCSVAMRRPRQRR